MGGIGFVELVIILVIVLLIFGPKKLPDLVRGFGQAIRGFKESARDTEHEDGRKPPARTSRKE
jgi:sec-independent protein translocase protein TatA